MMVETVSPPVTDIKFDVMDETELERPYRVIIHNDDVTPMDFVVAVLSHYFDINTAHAIEIMLEAHLNGQALVKVLPYAEAHQKVYAAQSSARDYGYPLAFSLEPD